MNDPSRKLMLIDGNSLTYRAFFALPDDLATASGQITNAVFGFTSMLINLVRDHKPDGIAVAFDRPEPTFRHEQVDTYKANRTAAPDILKQQMGLVREVLDAINIPTLELAGFEADDIIATLATQAAAEGFDVQVVTGDRDSYQLVQDPHIRVIYNKRGVSDYANYDEAGIQERTGVHPRDYVHYAALRGDNSDNLPGVPGVGEKTAAKLINKYGGINGIYEHLEEQTPKLRENLAANEDQVRLNVVIMDLVRDVPLEVGPSDLAELPPFDADAVRKLFDFLEFRTMLGRFHEAFGATGEEETAPVELEVLAPELRTGGIADLEAAIEGRTAPLAVARNPRPYELAGLAFAPASDGEPNSVLWIPIDDLVSDQGRAVLAVAADACGFAVHDAKPLLRDLLSLGLELRGLQLDTALAAYLLDPAGTSYEMDDVLAERAGATFAESDAVPEGQLDFGENTVTPAEEAALAALATAYLVAPLTELLETDGLTELNQTMETPLVSTLARMEHRGIGVDRAELERLNRDMTAEVEELTAQIHTDAGQEFNVNSTKVLQGDPVRQARLDAGQENEDRILNRSGNAGKTVWSAPDHRPPASLPRGGESSGQPTAHHSWPRCRTTTGFAPRSTKWWLGPGGLSSENPNLAQHSRANRAGPKLSDRLCRTPGTELLVADYNQIELRCIAHLAKDPGLIEAFTSQTDVHRSVASRVFDVEPGDVTFEQRSKAKMVSYGLAYGMEAYGLGQRLGIPHW